MFRAGGHSCFVASQAVVFTLLAARCNLAAPVRWLYLVILPNRLTPYTCSGTAVRLQQVHRVSAWSSLRWWCPYGPGKGALCAQAHGKNRLAARIP